LNPRGDEIFRTAQTGPGAHSPSYPMGTWSFPGVKWLGHKTKKCAQFTPTGNNCDRPSSAHSSVSGKLPNWRMRTINLLCAESCRLYEDFYDAPWPFNRHRQRRLDPFPPPFEVASFVDDPLRPRYRVQVLSIISRKWRRSSTRNLLPSSRHSHYPFPNVQARRRATVSW
jgi:hypothetical protein